MKALVAAVLLGACAFEPGSSSVGDDASVLPIFPDAPPGESLLTQTSSNAVVTGDSVYCQGKTGTVDNAWYRAFAPPQPFHLDYALFATEATLADDATVIVYSYTGELDGPTLDLTKMGQLATFAVASTTDATPQGFGTTVDMDLAGPFVICVVSTDAVTTSGQVTAYFHLGANEAGESAPSYWASHACQQDVPIAVSADLLIAADGKTS